MDLALVLLPSVTFGLLVTAHVALVALLSRKSPRWRAAVALVVPPLAPFWGFQERLRTWSGIWVFAVVAYLATLLVASTS